MSEQKGNRKYAKEFKDDAVRLVTVGGRSVSEVAAGLGVHKNVLYGWRRQYLLDQEQSFPGKGKLRQVDAEALRLKKELEEVREERDILKKALAIFSKGPK